MKSFTDALYDHILLFDGAMGTMLAPFVTNELCPEQLCSTRPDEVTRVHRMYVKAGSEIVATNTFGASPIKLRKHGLEDSADELNTRAVECARASGAAYVAGSMGPTGDFLSPYGTLTLDELIGSYARQAAALEKAGADVILIETMMDLAEARAAALGAKSATKLPVIITFTFESGVRTLMGNPPLPLVNMASAVKAAAVGVNCSGGPDTLLTVVEDMVTASNLPVIAQPNAGLPVMRDNHAVYELSPNAMAEGMMKILEAGVAGIGGCCGTTPEHIERMSAIVKGKSVPALVKREEFISSAREVVPLSALSDMSIREILENTSVYELDDDSSALALDFTHLSPDTALEKLTELQTITNKPLAVVVTGEQCLPLLMTYHGVAAIRCADNAALDRALGMCGGHKF